MPHAEWLRSAVHLRRLDLLAKQLQLRQEPGDDRE
jgi:hypothetical protein